LRYLSGEKVSTPGRIRTYDQRIRKPNSDDMGEHEGGISAGANTRDDVRGQGGTPVSAQAVQEVVAVDPIELALAGALTAATAAGQWQVVAQLATELQARREAREAPGVLSLARARAKRGGL
jgi:hypothetical protein